MKPLQNLSSANGTSFHNTVVTTTIETLVKVIGQPICFDNTGDDKVNVEWCCLNNNDSPITIYDWKEYRQLSENENIEFHIGGINRSETELAKDELLLLIHNI